MESMPELIELEKLIALYWKYSNRMQFMRKFTYVCIFLLTTLNFTFAQTMYISKNVNPLLYNDPNASSETVDTLSANQAVEVLQTNLENGFSYVRTSDNIEGWLPTSLLHKHPQAAQNSLWQRIQTQLDEVQKDWFPAKTISNSAVKNNADLKSQVMTLEKRVSILEEKQHDQWYWFILGAAVAIISIIIGRLLGGSRKRNSRDLYL